MELDVVKDDIDKILFSQSQIQSKVDELARQISLDYQGKQLLMVGILRGATTFLADLSRAMSIPVEIDYMAVSSYGSATKTSGVVRILKDLDEDIKGRDILLVEDIIDSGLTLSYLIKNLKSRSPASLEICALLNKEGRQRVPLEVKYLGFVVPNIFVVGYGLDYSQQYRNLPCICSLKPKVYGPSSR